MTTKTITIGLIVDYFPVNSVIDINNQHLTGRVTTIYDSANLDIYDQHLIIGMDVVTYGSFVRYPSRKDKWSHKFPFIATNAKYPNLRYEFVPGHTKDGTMNEVSRLSNEFKRITKNACDSFFAATGSEKNVVASGTAQDMVSCIFYILRVFIFSQNI